MRLRPWQTIWLLTTIFVAVITHSYTILLTAPPRLRGDINFIVHKGESLNHIAERLQKAAIIRNARAFSLLAILKGVQKRVKAGEYRLNPFITPLSILEKFSAGDVIRYRVTIPEGYNIFKIASLLENSGLVSMHDFIKVATDKNLVVSSGLEGDTFEGYLFPDTYILTKGMDAAGIIDKMVLRFREIYTDKIALKAKALGMSMRDVVTLASMIEKETARPEERRHISAVFHNRLKRGMPLQSDPTVIYDLHDFNGRLTKEVLHRSTPYNTYLNKGLPPGPIANPGRASIDAAVNPAADDYLYFVLKDNGSHYFSESLKEHNRAVLLYRRRK